MKNDQEKQEARKQGAWMGVSFLCAAYVFVGIALSGFVFSTGNGVLIAVSIVVYIVNLIVLPHANKQW